MPVKNKRMTLARTVGLPNIGWKRLIALSRAKISSFEQYGEKFDTPLGRYFYKDNGSDILAVAHLDTELPALHTSLVKLHDDTLFFCPTLDDRVGVYTILEYLPQVMKHDAYDILLTEGEEKILSTARYFTPPIAKRYKWVFSFDRAGTDVVAYQYLDSNLQKRLEAASWKVNKGTYSDIVDLEHLRCKAINFGVGYHGQHTGLCYLSRKEFMENIIKFMRFWRTNAYIALPHVPEYNTYIIGKGFMYVDDRRSQRTFTDNEIECITLLESVSYEFEDWISIIVPEDMPKLFDEYQRLASDEMYIKELELKRKNQMNLFPGEKTLKFQKIHGEVKSKIIGSEDFLGLDEKQSRKTGDELTKTSTEKAITVTHIRKDLVEKFVKKGVNTTTFLEECSTCHKPFQFDPNSEISQCPDCIGDESDVKAIDEKSKKKGLSIVANIPLFKRKANQKELVYDETTSEWYETGTFNGPPKSNDKPSRKYPVFKPKTSKEVII